MDYQHVKNRLTQIHGIEDDQTADAVVKSVLGHLVSRVDEEEARKIGEHLPQELSLENLRGHQQHVTSITADQFVADVADQFNVPGSTAKEAIHVVLGAAKEDFPEEHKQELKTKLPQDWQALIEEA